MLKLTDRTLKALTVEAGQKDRLVFDSECPGLGVRVTVKGTKGFLVQWTDPATKRKVREPLGVWGSITVEQARTAARSRLGDVAKGIDPLAERTRRKKEAEASKAERALTLETLVSQWSEMHLFRRSPRYRTEAARTIRTAYRAHLNTPAAQLTRAAALAVLDDIARQGKLSMAAQVMGHARACYAWAEKRGRVTANPFRNLPLAATAQERDRVLTPAETAEIWAAAGALAYPFGPFFQLALLTIQRREEVAGMRWSELSVDGTLWTIPAERMKNNRANDVHMASAARGILKTIPRREGCDLVFTTNGLRPISGYSKAKIALDAAIAKARADAGGAPGKLMPWRLHDFRRTGVSRLAALGFDSLIVDKILAHRPAKLKGVASIYQRHDFARERAAALDAWAAHVTSTPDLGNVLRFSRAGKADI